MIVNNTQKYKFKSLWQERGLYQFGKLLWNWVRIRSWDNLNCVAFCNESIASRFNAPWIVSVLWLKSKSDKHPTVFDIWIVQLRRIHVYCAHIFYCTVWHIPLGILEWYPILCTHLETSLFEFTILAWLAALIELNIRYGRQI